MTYYTADSSGINHVGEYTGEVFTELFAFRFKVCNRNRENERQRETKRERKRESVCVCGGLFCVFGLLCGFVVCCVQIFTMLSAFCFESVCVCVSSVCRFSQGCLLSVSKCVAEKERERERVCVCVFYVGGYSGEICACVYLAPF